MHWNKHVFFTSVLLLLTNCLFSLTLIVEAHKNCFDNEKHSCRNNRFPIEENYFECKLVHTLSISPKKMAYIDGNLLFKVDDKVYKINSNSTYEPFDNVRFPSETIQHKGTTYGSAKGKAYMNVQIPDELPQVYYITTDGNNDGHDEISLNRKTEKLYIVKTIKNSNGAIQEGNLYIVDINNLRIVDNRVFADKIEVPAIITTATIPIDSNDVIFSVVSGEGTKIVSFKEHKTDPCDTISRSYTGTLDRLSNDNDTKSLISIIRDNEMKLIDFFKNIKNSKSSNLERFEGGKSVSAVEVENRRLKRELDIAVKKFDNLRSKLIPLSILSNNKQRERENSPASFHKNIVESQLPEFTLTSPRPLGIVNPKTTSVPKELLDDLQNSLNQKDDELRSCNSMLNGKLSMLRLILESADKE